VKEMFICGLLAAFLGSPMLAEGILYECDITDHEQARGWISPKIAIILPDNASVKVVDALTLSFAKEPVSGTISRNNTKRLIVNWSLKGVKADNGTSFAAVNYRASMSKATGAVSVTTIPAGYDNGLRASGNCKARRG
jgi:hypothetical protein